MKPYYEEAGITLFHGDCLEVLPEIAQRYEVGLVLTSPPYNLRDPEGPKSLGGGTYAADVSKGYGEHDDAMPRGEYVNWQKDVLIACWDTLTEDGAIFYNHKPRVTGTRVLLPLELIPAELPLRQIVIWDRGSGFNRRFHYFVPAHEWIMVIAKEAWRTTTRSIDDVWRIPFETDSDHPAPFPLSLARRAVDSTAAEMILDPFAGSGTTLVAAKEAGRKAIGIEIEERFCEMTAKRLSQGTLSLGFYAEIQSGGINHG